MTCVSGRPDRNRSAYPLRRLADGILPYLRELDDRERTPEETKFLADIERLKGRVLTSQEENIAIAQARMIGDL